MADERRAIHGLAPVVAAVAVGSLLAGCAAAPPPRTPAAALLGPPPVTVDHLEERALLLLVADRRTYEPVSIGAALDASPEVRRQAALTLARIGDPRGGPELEGLLADPDVDVRRAAVFALGELGEKARTVPGGGDKAAEAVKAAASALLGMVNADDRATGRLAVEALAKVGVTVGTVVERLIEGGSDELLPRLLPSLFRFQSRDEPSAAVVHWGVEGLAREEPELHAMAAYALARTPVAEGLVPLRSLVDDPDPWVRGWAARALGEVGERPDLDRLRPLLDDPQPGPIIQALRAARRLIAAGKAAAPYEWQPRLLELLDDPRPGVRLTAIEASASWLLDEELGARLSRFLEAKDGGESRERQLALLALAEGEDPSARTWLPSAADADDPALRRAAVRAAGLVGAGEVIDQLTEDRDASVRAVALETWLAAEPEDAADVAALALADDDDGVRASAFEWLVDHPVAPLEVLLPALEASRRDRILDARVAGVRAVGARARSEPLERGALVAALEKLAKDGEYQVRRQAAAELVALGSEAPDPGGLRLRKPVDVYREIVRRTVAPRRVEIRTERGVLTVELACPEAPMTCLNFLQLGTQGFYDGLPFHRVVPDFVVQAGDDRGDGRGGPGYTIRDEINLLRYDRGAVGMALSGPDTGGSQFFITLSKQPHLDGGYTVFGRVVDGFGVLDEIVQGDRILGVAEVAP